MRYFVATSYTLAKRTSANMIQTYRLTFVTPCQPIDNFLCDRLQTKVLLCSNVHLKLFLFECAVPILNSGFEFGVEGFCFAALDVRN